MPVADFTVQDAQLYKSPFAMMPLLNISPGWVAKHTAVFPVEL